MLRASVSSVALARFVIFLELRETLAVGATMESSVVVLE